MSACLEAVREPSASRNEVGSRLLSLDAFRGATILLMILVNSAGGPESYGALQHAAWNGWTLTDTVFPSFLWIVGVAITLSLGKKLESGVRPSGVLPKIIQRSLILFVLGLSVYIFPTFSLSDQRIMGVLQRIAICYLLGSVIYIYASVRTQIFWILGLLAAYWLMMTCINVPGYGYGRLDEQGNFAHYVDRIVLGTHNYVETKTWDPEGIVSTLPALATTLLGILAGHVLRIPLSLSKRRLRLAVIGLGLISAGLVCSIWLPINKKLWTDSFALFMAGLDFVALAIFIWLIDERGFRKPFQPLLVVGVNALVAYLVSEFLGELLDSLHVQSGSTRLSVRQFVYVHGFAPFASPVNASLLFACVVTALMYLLAHVLYKRSYYVRI